MKIKEAINEFKLLEIKGILKLKQILCRMKLISADDLKEKYGPLNGLRQYFSANKISIRLYKKDEENKEFLLKLIQLLEKNEVDVELIEFEKIFNNEDIKEILEKNPNVKIDLRHMINSYFYGKNVVTKYDIKDYCEILQKVTYLSNITKANFKVPEEQVMFVITQLADYISCANPIETDTKDEDAKDTSSLKGALLKGETVCIGYALACQQCLSDLGFECNIVGGNANSNEPGADDNHAWNQVKIGNRWYNIDLTWFSIIKNSTDNESLKYILADDKSFENHYATGTYVRYQCDNPYEGRKEIYEKVKNIKNVLKAYDSGKNDTILQYKITNVPLKTHEKENEKMERGMKV